MKFVYEYRSSDNVRHSGTVNAATREDAFSALKGRGIRPSRLDEAPGFFNKLFGKGKRWIAIGVLCALCLVLCAVLFRTTHQAQGTRHEAQTSDRHQIYGDPVIMEEMELSGYASVFSHPGERFLAYFAQPGREVSLPADLSRLIAQGTNSAQGTDCASNSRRPTHKAQCTILTSCLTNAISFAASDSREVAELKRIVNGLKDELRAYLASGTAEGYIRELWDRQHEEQLIYKRVLNELEGNPDPVLREERNRSLRELGLRTVPRPKKPAE